MDSARSAPDGAKNNATRPSVRSDFPVIICIIIHLGRRRSERSRSVVMVIKGKTQMRMIVGKAPLIAMLAENQGGHYIVEVAHLIWVVLEDDVKLAEVGDPRGRS